jgi:tRNA dimethylallyltransferase
MHKPLIAIVGPTASGKSSIAHRLALQFGGEIICGDSQTLRRTLDIGTAKPNTLEQKEVRYHLLDIIEPYDTFSAHQFKKAALAAIDYVYSRGKIPFLVGGTGMYIDSVLYDYSFRPVDTQKREMYEALGVDTLQQEIIDKGYTLPQNVQNKRHLIGVLMSGGASAEKSTLRAETLVIGIHRDDDILKQRIVDRVNSMFKSGLVAEVKDLVVAVGVPPKGWKVLGYDRIIAALEQETDAFDEELLKQQIVRDHWQYARRQKTWFRRSRDIQWITNEVDITNTINKFIHL